MHHDEADPAPGHGRRLAHLTRFALQLGAALATMAAAAQAPAGAAPAAPHDAAMQRGWQVFQTRCAVCHAPDAGGRRNAPNLLARIASMDLPAFSAAVLNGHAQRLKAGETAAEGSPERRAWLAEVQGRAEGRLAMPDWSQDDEVEARIADVYGYLRARADGRLDARAPRPALHGSPVRP